MKKCWSQQLKDKQVQNGAIPEILKKKMSRATCTISQIFYENLSNSVKR